VTSSLLVLEQTPISEMKRARRERLFERIGDMADMPRLSSDTTVARRFALPFYTNVDLVELTDRNWLPAGGRLCFLKRGKDLVRLNGTSPPIHTMNAKADLVITRDSLLSYLAFFCFFVRGDEGPFFIVDRLDNPFLPDSSRGDTFAEVFRPPSIWGQDQNGDWRVSAVVYYSNAIFFADFLVHLSGMVEMVDDTPIAADLDDKVEAPLSIEESLSS